MGEDIYVDSIQADVLRTVFALVLTTAALIWIDRGIRRSNPGNARVRLAGTTFHWIVGPLLAYVFLLRCCCLPLLGQDVQHCGVMSCPHREPTGCTVDGVRMPRLARVPQGGHVCADSRDWLGTTVVFRVEWFPDE